jgi:hypothetical protein
MIERPVRSTICIYFSSFAALQIVAQFDPNIDRLAFGLLRLPPRLIFQKIMMAFRGMPYSPEYTETRH